MAFLVWSGQVAAEEQEGTEEGTEEEEEEEEEEALICSFALETDAGSSGV